MTDPIPRNVDHGYTVNVATEAFLDGFVGGGASVLLLYVALCVRRFLASKIKTVTVYQREKKTHQKQTSRVGWMSASSLRRNGKHNVSIGETVASMSSKRSSLCIVVITKNLLSTCPDALNGFLSYSLRN